MAAMLPLAALSLSSAPHPMLSPMWKATVKEVQVGVVYESEHFVSDKQGGGISATNPSAKWTNYTDGSCRRLIHQTSGYDTTRYLLGCDAVACCKETDADGPLEYQISNVHPAALAPVRSLGNQTIELYNGDQVVAEGYSWKFLIENSTAYVTTAPGAEFATLHRWDVRTEGQLYRNDYVDYTVIPKEEGAAFARTFHVPQVCEGNILNCDNAHKAGKITSKTLTFLRSGRKPQPRH